MRTHVSAALIAMLTMASASIPARADVDRSPKPGGVYLLKPGIFVAGGYRCQDAPNVAIRRYDRKGISTPHTHACIARIVSKRRSGYGNVYKVSQSCLDTGTGQGRRFTEQQRIDIPDATDFTMKSEGNTKYSYCPILDLPRSLRKAAQ